MPKKKSKSTPKSKPKHAGQAKAREQHPKAAKGPKATTFNPRSAPVPSIKMPSMGGARHPINSYESFRALAQPDRYLLRGMSDECPRLPGSGMPTATGILRIDSAHLNVQQFNTPVPPATVAQQLLPMLVLSYPFGATLLETAQYGQASNPVSKNPLIVYCQPTVLTGYSPIGIYTATGLTQSNSWYGVEPDVGDFIFQNVDIRGYPFRPTAGVLRGTYGSTMNAASHVIGGTSPTGPSFLLPWASGIGEYNDDVSLQATANTINDIRCTPDEPGFCLRYPGPPQLSAMHPTFGARTVNQDTTTAAFSQGRASLASIVKVLAKVGTKDFAAEIAALSLEIEEPKLTESGETRFPPTETDNVLWALIYNDSTGSTTVQNPLAYEINCAWTYEYEPDNYLGVPSKSADVDPYFAHFIEASMNMPIMVGPNSFSDWIKGATQWVKERVAPVLNALGDKMSARAKAAVDMM